jgi:hypothetical protein
MRDSPISTAEYHCAAVLDRVCQRFKSLSGWHTLLDYPLEQPKTHLVTMMMIVLIITYFRILYISNFSFPLGDYFGRLEWLRGSLILD